MKHCTLVFGHFGQYFFDGDKLITYIHENDGHWSAQSYGPIAKHYGIKMVVSEPNEAQRAQMFDEQDAEI